MDELGARHGFEVDGVEKTASEYAAPVQGTLIRQLRRLLADFNHVIVQAGDGKIERVIILSRKQPGAGRIVLATQRRGEQHIVQATITGDNRRPVPVTLMVDTGAELVVLPASMLSELGFDAERLEERTMQTANGVITAKVARLAAFDLGPETLFDVEAAFVDDQRIGNIKLLGMNVLGRYRIIIDEHQDRITLIRSP